MMSGAHINFMHAGGLHHSSFPTPYRRSQSLSRRVSQLSQSSQRMSQKRRNGITMFFRKWKRRNYKKI
uniref:Ovule protein n=1 Tax=Strongyloides venezuelensis TaxID=75913 RepID=A0A0K0EUS2_STRVS